MKGWRSRENSRTWKSFFPGGWRRRQIPFPSRSDSNREKTNACAWAGLWSWTTDYSKPFPYFIPLADFRRLRAGFLRTEPTLVLCASFFWTRWKLLLSTVCVACLFRRVWWKFGKMKILQLGKIFYPLEGKLIIKKKRLSRERKREREGSNFFNFF